MRERREKHRRRVLEGYGGSLLNLHLTFVSVNVRDKFSKPGEGTTNISKKKIFGAHSELRINGFPKPD